jgi:hypothetical protein
MLAFVFLVLSLTFVWEMAQAGLYAGLAAMPSGPRGALVPRVEPPFPKPFANDHVEEVHGLLFVHGDPFVNLLGGINWHVLGAELGPKE